ncbi:MAG: PAS domain S-box protein, partial [Chitinophagaceae bacterium]
LLQQRLRRWSRYLIYIIATIALLVLVGWQFNITLLKSVSPQMVAMSPASAVSLCLASLAFFLRTYPKTYKRAVIAGYVCSILVLLIGLHIVVNLFFETAFRLDASLFIEKLEANGKGGQPNRMAPNTAFCFVLAGIALLLLQYENKKGRMVAHYISLFIALLSLLSLLGYLYKVPEFYGVFSYVAMALNTSICFFLFAAAILFSSPENGFMREFTSTLNGSVSAKLFIPAAFIVPAALGLLRLWGNWNGVYSHEFGVVVYASITILIFVCVAWYNTYSQNRRDLLEREAETLLRNNEAHTRAILDNAPDAVVVMDDKGNVVRWNQQSEHLFGWTAEEAIGRLLSDMIIPTEFREAHRKGMNRYLVTGESSIMGKTIDLWAMRKDGTPVDVSLRIAPLAFNDERLFIGFIRDITERKVMEDRLKTFNDELARQVEQKTTELTDIFERITDGFIALDENFQYSYINKKAGELIQMQPASLIGKYIWDIFPDAIGSKTYFSLNEAMERQEYICSTDYYEPLNLWQENHIYPSPKGLSVFIRDITDRKKAAQAISDANDLADKLIDSLPG